MAAFGINDLLFEKVEAAGENELIGISTSNIPYDGSNGRLHEVQLGLMSDIVHPDLSYEENYACAHENVYIRLFMKFVDGSVYYRNEYEITLAEVVGMAMDQYLDGTLDNAQTTYFEAFWREFSDVFPEYELDLGEVANSISMQSAGSGSGDISIDFDV